MFDKIEIGNANATDCPAFPFALNTGTECKLTNQQHKVTEVVINPTNSNTKYMAPKLTITEYVPSKESLWIKENNEKSVKARVFSLDKDTLTIPLDFKTLGVALGILASMITFVTFIRTCFCTSPQVQPSDRINVITAAVPPQPPPTNYVRYYPLPPPALSDCPSIFSRHYALPMRSECSTGSIYSRPASKLKQEAISETQIYSEPRRLREGVRL